MTEGRKTDIKSVLYNSYATMIIKKEAIIAEEATKRFGVSLTLLDVQRKVRQEINNHSGFSIWYFDNIPFIKFYDIECIRKNNICKYKLKYQVINEEKQRNTQGGASLPNSPETQSIQEAPPLLNDLP